MIPRSPPPFLTVADAHGRSRRGVPADEPSRHRTRWVIERPPREGQDPLLPPLPRPGEKGGIRREKNRWRRGQAPRTNDLPQLDRRPPTGAFMTDPRRRQTSSEVLSEAMLLPLRDFTEHSLFFS